MKKETKEESHLLCKDVVLIAFLPDLCKAVVYCNEHEQLVVTRCDEIEY